MHIAIVVDDLTALRYFVPFSRKLFEFFPEVKQSFKLMRESHKYNGMASDSNFNKCLNILERFCYYKVEIDDSFEYDIVFQVEVGQTLKCKKRISFEHGFDYVFKTQQLKTDVDLYIVNAEYIAKNVESFGIRTIVSPMPICTWELDKLVVPDVKQKTAMIFYPDQGLNDLAKKVLEELERLNYVVFVKQRKKHQQIVIGGTHVYDNVWYPSEAVTLPSMVNVVVGFGSSAYVDLVPVGVHYINIDVKHDTSPWNTFVHPEDSNYIRVLNEDQILNAINVADGKSSQLNLKGSEFIRDFIVKLIT